MAIYEILPNDLHELDQTTFGAEGVLEKQGLQRLLRERIDVVVQDVLVIAEEFCQWEDSKRRIDLLGIDKAANLVVIELKRTKSGGHMELQAIRYAAMVSPMTFQHAVEVYRDFLAKRQSVTDPRESILEFLEWEEPDEDRFAQDVRIVLVSADFSRELSTSVIWLNSRGLDIECVRFKPYRDGVRILADIQQVIPLPEAKDFQIRLAAKQHQERAERSAGSSSPKFDVSINGQTQCGLSNRAAMFAVVQHLVGCGHAPEELQKQAVPWRPKTMFRLAEVATQLNPSQYFCGDGELLHSNGKTYALAKKWGKRCAQAIENLIELFGNGTVSFRPSKSEAGERTAAIFE